MVVISLRDPGAREDITDPFYLRCLLELYCRNPQDWDSLLYAIEGLVPIPFVDHLGRRLTLAECQRATFWFLTLCQWCRTSGHSSFSIQEGSGNPVAVCNLCLQEVSWDQASQDFAHLLVPAVARFTREHGRTPIAHPRRVNNVIPQ
jgi:hypothetical protein